MISYFINFLTIARIVLGALIFILIISPNGQLLALLLFFIAGLTDYFDGFLARKYNSVSQVGEILDPIADKILIVFILFALSVNLSSYLIAFCSSMIISREIFVSALRDYSSRNHISDATKVTFIAKIKTTIQLFTIFIYLLALTISSMLMLVIADFLLIASMLVTLYTGYIYATNIIERSK